MTSYEVHRLEQLLLEFGQREAPSPQVPVTRPPLTRKRSQSYIEGVADADKRPRLQWRKKEERDQSGRIASWVDDRTPPPGVPRPPAPVTGTHTSSVYRPPHPRGQEAASPKEDFPKRNVSADQSIAGKGKGQGSSFIKGTNAPVKGTPRGSVGRAMSSRPEDSVPRRGNIPKDLLGPPLHTPPPVPSAKPQIPKPPSMPPPCTGESSSNTATSKTFTTEGSTSKGASSKSSAARYFQHRQRYTGKYSADQISILRRSHRRLQTYTIGCNLP